MVIFDPNGRAVGWNRKAGVPAYNSYEKLPEIGTVFTTEHVPPRMQRGRRWIGTSVAAANALSLDGLWDKFWSDIYSDEVPNAGILVPLRDGDEGPAVLIWHSQRQMNREIGPVLSVPTTMAARTEVMSAYVNWDEVKQGYEQLQYSGFVYLSVLEGEVITGSKPGWGLPFAAMWWELQRSSVIDVMEWFEGSRAKLRDPWEEEVAVGVLMHQGSGVNIPVEASKHLWEMGGLCWATARGADRAQARYRTMRAVDAVVKLNPWAAYRSDFGWVGGQSEDTLPTGDAPRQCETPDELPQEDQACSTQHHLEDSEMPEQDSLGAESE